MVVVPATAPVAALEVAVMVMGVAEELTIVPSPGVAASNVISPVLAVQVTELVMSCVVVPSE